MIKCACGCGEEILPNKRGRIKAKYKKGHQNKGKHQSEEHKNKIGVSNKKIPHPGGEKHPQWGGGTWNYWKKQALIRDDYICQICGFREPEIMVVDHIKPKSLYPDLKFEMNNLITLCPNCHMRKTQRERKNKLYIRKDGD